MYIPQLQTTLRVYGLLRKASTEEKQDWLICFLHILRWGNPDLIRQWLVLEEEKYRWLLLTVFEECITSFKDTKTIHQTANVVANWYARLFFSSELSIFFSEAQHFFS
jgi:hypothetical protein